MRISSVGRVSRAPIWHICISRDELGISRDELDIFCDKLGISCATAAAPSLPISGALATWVRVRMRARVGATFRHGVRVDWFRVREGWVLGSGCGQGWGWGSR